jgi:hypothetical protein
MKKTSTTSIVIIVLILISIAGGVFITYSTANGPWGFTDSVVYISTAQNILNGGGLDYFEANAKLNPLSHYPPLIPIILSMIGFFKIDLVDAFRWLNIISFVGTIFLSGWIFVRYTHTPVIGIMTAILMCVFPVMVTMFSSAYSEPVFILLLLLAGGVIFEYLQTERSALFIIGSILIGLLPLVRYLGLSILVSAVLFIFLFTNDNVKKRLGRSALFGMIASIPISLWLMRVYFSTVRSIGVWSLSPAVGDISTRFQDFRALFMDTVWKWIPFQSMTTSLHYRTRFLLLGMATLVILGLSLFTFRRLIQHAPKEGAASGFQLFTFFGIVTFFFMIFLIGSYLFSYPTVAIDDRMLLPVYGSIILCLFGGLSLWQHTWFHDGLRWLQIFPFLLTIICAVWFIPQASDNVQIFHSGYGLTAYKWRNSETIRAIRSLPAAQPVISNDWELLLLWTGRPVYGLWNTLSVDPLQVTPYGSNTSDPVQDVFCEQGAALVIFSDFKKQMAGKLGQTSSAQRQDLFSGLPVMGQYADGIVYICR